MGMSLYVSGALPSRAAREACLEFAGTWAQEHEWLVAPTERKLATVELGSSLLEAAKVHGLSLLAHPACEMLALHFLGDSGVMIDGYLEDTGGGKVKAREGAMMKTLFGGTDAHRDLCEFLRELRARFIPSLVVDDETGFFGTSDEAQLLAAEREGWSTVRGAFLAPDAAQDDEADVGGFRVVRSERGRGLSEFARLEAEDRVMLETLAAELRTNFGGLGLQFPESADGLMDLDLLLDEADEQNLAQRTEDEAAEQLVHCAGAGFGRILIALYGGHWVRGEEDGMEIADLGGSGLRLDPFQCAADRLMEGSVHSFTNYGDVVARFARYLGNRTS